MYAAASFPVKNGSSEKDSKFLPPINENGWVSTAKIRGEGDEIFLKYSSLKVSDFLRHIISMERR